MPSWGLAGCALQPSRSGVSTKEAAASVAPHHGLLARPPKIQPPMPAQLVGNEEMPCRWSSPQPPGCGANMVVAAFCPRLSQQLALASVDSDGFELCWSEAQNLRTQSTPAFEPVRVKLRVCAPAFRSCLTRFVRLAALVKRSLTTQARRRLPSCR